MRARALAALALLGMASCQRLGFHGALPGDACAVAADCACLHERCACDGGVCRPDGAALCGDESDCAEGQRCAAGLCRDTPTEIYRSVGVGGELEPVAVGGGGLSVLGTLATFSAALPDRVGVGDALVYAAADGSDALAFVHRRLSTSAFHVYTAAGGVPAPTTADTSFAFWRAYTSLADALIGDESSGIDPALRDFDTWSVGKDLVSAYESWNIACYADAVDTTLAVACDDSPTSYCPDGAGWLTGSAHLLHIYTPTRPDEVGVSQRHGGAWGNGYRRTDGLIIELNHAWVDGLAIQQASDGERVFIFAATGAGGDVRVSNNFGHVSATTGPGRVFDVWSSGVVGPTPMTIAFYNNIGISESTDAGNSVFFLNTLQANVSIFNSTAVATSAGSAFYGYAGSTSVKNALGIANGAEPAFEETGEWTSVANCVSNDGSVATLTNTNSVAANQTVVFVDGPGGDYHLWGLDAGARGRGANYSALPGLSPVWTDIDGQTRPASGAWDVGADQVVAATVP